MSRLRSIPLPRSGRARLVTGTVFFALLLAVIGPWIAPYNPTKPTLDVLVGPSWSHPMGTDADGIDVLSVVVAGFRVDVLIAIVAVGIAVTGGVIVGSVAGYTFGGNRATSALAAVVLRALDFVQTIPVFILALALVGTLGPSVTNVIAAIAFVNLPFIARLMRTAVRHTEALDFVTSCRALGRNELNILVRHVIPNSLDSVIASASAGVGGAILLTAGLSFLGAGIRPPTPEWGAEIANGANYVITGQWWIGLFPGLVLAAIVLGFALSGDLVRFALKPDRGQAYDSSLAFDPENNGLVANAGAAE